MARQRTLKKGWGLEIGDVGPFPIPLWRIGANELETIKVCRAYVEAQRKYASVDHDTAACSNTPSIS